MIHPASSATADHDDPVIGVARRSSGFTRAELTVIIAIIVICATVVRPRVLASRLAADPFAAPAAIHEDRGSEPAVLPELSPIAVVREIGDPPPLLEAEVDDGELAWIVLRPIERDPWGPPTLFLGSPVDAPGEIAMAGAVPPRGH
jgi:hypothetical protein